MSSQEMEVSVVLPCLNESETVGICVEKARAYFALRGISGEVIVVDNGSTDDSVEKALRSGARVVREGVKGYGAAYLRGFREAQGKFLIMGDSDDTYDFSDLDPFLNPLRNGAGLVMGSRFRGRIGRHAMPWANRYIGNPVLTGLYRLFFKTQLSDIHCGMRSMTREAYRRLDLHCLGMEFASEMVLEAIRKKITITEVPIDYFVRRGQSKLRPVADAWRHLRFMLLFCPDWLYFVPGLLLFGTGFPVLIALMNGTVFLFGHAWDVHMLILAAFMSILGYQIIHVGLYAKLFAVKLRLIDRELMLDWFSKYLRLETGLLIGGAFFLIGFAINLGIFFEWWQGSFGALHRVRESVGGMTFMVLGLQTVFSSFFLSLIVIKR